MAHFRARQHGKVSLSIALIVPLLLHFICIVGLIVYACYHSDQTIKNNDITLLLVGLCAVLCQSTSKSYQLSTPKSYQVVV